MAASVQPAHQFVATSGMVADHGVDAGQILTIGMDHDRKTQPGEVTDQRSQRITLDHLVHQQQAAQTTAGQGIEVAAQSTIRLEDGGMQMTAPERTDDSGIDGHAVGQGLAGA